ncbi:hypothetical protein CLAFUW4_05113 [Fulvia fulva]|nr:hypothetical protein CLAFUR4_05099 [Fulvia fulva]WPV13536.1 hypothetical protein CLAFUW4_05113 [Fulvia fulva]
MSTRFRLISRLSKSLRDINYAGSRPMSQKLLLRPLCTRYRTPTVQTFNHTCTHSTMAHTTFPTDIPAPTDDGACNHLPGLKLPSIPLPSTAGNTVDISTLAGLTVLFCYPRTGGPNETITEEWNQIPGARGCTPQACSFRDASKEFLTLGVSHIFGASTQGTAYQREVKERMHLPYQLLSDEKLELAQALNLPTFEWQGSKLIKRLTMAIEDGEVIKVFYPVFPPDQSANEVLKWLGTYDGRKNLSTEGENQTTRNMQKK